MVVEPGTDEDHGYYTSLNGRFQRYRLRTVQFVVGELCNRSGFTCRSNLLLQGPECGEYFLISEEFMELCMFIANNASMSRAGDGGFVICLTPALCGWFSLLRG